MHQFASRLLFASFLLLSPVASAAQLQIAHMSISGGSLSEPLIGLYPTLIHIGPDTDLVGGYIGSGGTTTTGPAEYAADNLMVFELGGATASVYTAASNLGDINSPAGSKQGGAVAQGTLDPDAGIITLDVKSFFLNANDTDHSIAPAPWLGSPPVTGTWDGTTGFYNLEWSFYMPGFGFGSTWYLSLTGTATPVPEVSVLGLWITGLGLLLPWMRKRSNPDDKSHVRLGFRLTKSSGALMSGAHGVGIQPTSCWLPASPSAASPRSARHRIR